MEKALEYAMLQLATKKLAEMHNMTVEEFEKRLKEK